MGWLHSRWTAIRSRPGRCLGLVCLALAAILGLVLGGVAVQGLRLALDVRHLRADATGLVDPALAGKASEPDRGTLISTRLARVQSDTHRMRSLTSSVAWRAGSYLPGLSGSIDSVTSLVEAVDKVALHVAPALTDVAGSYSSTKRSGVLDLRAVTHNRVPLRGAETELERVLAALRGDDLSNPTVRRAQTEIVNRLTVLQALLHPLVLVAEIGGPMTGEQGPRHYLLALQTPAEGRATGGLVGSFLEVVVDHGAVRVVRSGTNRDLDEQAADDVTTVAGGFSTTWGPFGAQRRWYSSNLSLDFPSVTSVWAALYQRQYGVRLDGLVGITPELLTNLLQSTGGIPLPDGGTLEASGAARFLESGLYAKFPLVADEARRNAYQLQILQRLVRRVFEPQTDLTGLVRAVREDVANGSVKLASTHPQEQRVLAATAIAGALPTASAPFVAWSSQNIAGDKLDVYLHRAMTSRRMVVGSHEQVAASITLRNDAPSSGLPEYVTVRSDLSPAQQRRAVVGTNRLLVTTYLSAGAMVRSVTLNGAPVSVRVGIEKGHPLVIVDLVLPPHGGTATVVVTADEPTRTGAVQTLRQPTSTADTIDLQG
jgi:hypothetical protein